MCQYGLSLFHVLVMMSALTDLNNQSKLLYEANSDTKVTFDQFCSFKKVRPNVKLVSEKMRENAFQFWFYV